MNVRTRGGALPVDPALTKMRQGRSTMLRLCVLLALSVPGAAHAACDANNQYSFSFGTQAAATLSYAGSYNYTAANPLGATQPFTVSFGTNGTTSTTVGGTQMPAITNLLTDGTNNRTLMVGGTFGGRTAAIAANTRVIRTNLTFAQPVRDLTLTVHDVDFANNQYRDWFMVTGGNGAASYAASLSTPYGSNNGTGPRSATGSTLTLGPATTPFNITAAEAVGTSTSANTGVSNGDVSVSFPQPVTTVTLRYGSYPLSSGETATGQQAYGLSRVAFCPMPNVSVTKTSATFETTGANRFNVPGAEVVYTITVNNSGGSPVDLDGMAITDPLPGQAVFFNGDYNGSGAGTAAFGFNAGTSGVSMPASALSFSNNGGASFAYTPATGFDPAVNAVRFAPAGSMAANSSFQVSFRARIK